MPRNADRLEIVFRPIESRLLPKCDYRSAPFRRGHMETMRDLEREARHLEARHALILCCAHEGDFRLDGQLKAGALLVTPSIALHLDTPRGPMRFPCGRYADWKDNLRAIVLSLESLRAVDRYGVTRTGEQYRGWSALPAAAEPQESDPWTTVDEAAAWLRDQSGLAVPPSSLIDDAEAMKDAYRAAAKRHHPDVGGSPATFARITRAKAYVEACMAGGVT